MNVRRVSKRRCLLRYLYQTHYCLGAHVRFTGFSWLGDLVDGTLSPMALWCDDNGAMGSQSVISVEPAPSNNRLKLTARGRPGAEAPRRSRAAA